MTTRPEIPGSDEAWDTGELGQDKEHAKKLQENIESQIDNALDLQQISIRLQKSLIEDFKYIAGLNGIGYQPLMRQILKRFADCEKKRILRERFYEMKEMAEREAEESQPPRQRKTA